VDDTNLNLKHIERFKAIAAEGNHQFQVINMVTDVEECIARDEVRDKKVGADVIWNMAYQFGVVKQKREWIWLDLDGTVCDISKRLKKSTKNNKGKEYLDYDEFFNPSNIALDVPRFDVLKMVEQDIKDGYEIIICSGRSDRTRVATEEWLKRHWLTKGQKFWSRLIMRSEGDCRPDTILKQDYINKYLDISKCVKAYDDRPSVIRQLKKNQMNVIDVGTGINF